MVWARCEKVYEVREMKCGIVAREREEVEQHRQGGSRREKRKNMKYKRLWLGNG